MTKEEIRNTFSRYLFHVNAMSIIKKSIDFIIVTHTDT